MADDSNAWDRRGWMSLLAKCPAEALLTQWEKLALTPDHRMLRSPETGSVMVRGRAGGTGAAFNLGEMTVTRCSLRLATGEEGHACVQGRDKRKATQAALLDALMQTHHAPRLTSHVLEPLRDAARQAQAAQAEKAAATKVDFFTMARGED